jgi:FkbM family methyltransferase
MRVIAFEPDPTALAILKQRFSGNDRVTIEGKAVGATAGRAPFFQTDAVRKGTILQTQWSSLDRRDLHDGAVAEVEIVDLVAYIQALPERVSILKLDIEGTEAEVLEAILDAGVEKTIGLVVAETHERFSPELSLRIDRLKGRISANSITNVELGWH